MAPARSRSFYKILHRPSDPHLAMPHTFVTRNFDNSIPLNITLQSATGGHSWPLKIRKIGESFCFADGWRTVVEDAQLGFEDFLVFKLVDASTFKLSIYAQSGCLKDLPLEDDGDGVGVEDDSDCFIVEKQFNYVHPYIDQFPKLFHPYIRQVQDVKHDGNCGFRAISACLGRDEEDWDTIRYELIFELRAYKEHYLHMFDQEEYDSIYKSLDFFERNTTAPFQYWMRMPQMGVIIASRYNVILHSLSIAACTAYFPLRSQPPSSSNEHIAIAIGHVNNNHFVRVALTGEYPIPTIALQWVYYKYPNASTWTISYQRRLDKYTRYLLRS